MFAKAGMLGKLAIVTTVALALRLLAPGALAELERLILKDNGLVCFENGGIAGKTEAYDAYIEEFLSQEDPNGLPRVADSTAYRPLTIRDDIVYDQNGNAIGILSGSAAPEAPQISKEPSEPEKRPSAPAASTPAEVYSSSTTVYAKASASGKELATLEKGTRLDILSSHGEWVKISCEGNEGFVQVEDLALLERMVGEVQEAAYVRDAATGKSVQLPAGTIVFVAGKAENDFRIENLSGTATGWIAKDALAQIDYPALPAQLAQNAALYAIDDETGASQQIPPQGAIVYVVGEKDGMLVVEDETHAQQYKAEKMSVLSTTGEGNWHFS